MTAVNDTKMKREDRGLAALKHAKLSCGIIETNEQQPIPPNPARTLAVAVEAVRPEIQNIHRLQTDATRAFGCDRGGLSPAYSGRRGRRRATIFVPLLLISALVGVIGLSALTATRIESKGTIERADLLEARSLALSAIELGLQRIESNPNWRDVFPNGNWFSNVALDGGTFSLDGTDGDGLPLNNNPSDGLILLGIGSYGRARFKLQVTLTSQAGGLNSLESSLHSNLNMGLSGTTVTGASFISSNASVTASSSSIFPAVEATNTISGATYHGSTSAGADAREMPDASTVFASYIAEGTLIDITAIPLSGGVRTISNTLFSPGSNPYGAQKNTKGVYVVECKGQVIRLSRVRIQGTLVLLDAPASSSIIAEQHWDNEISNYPVLMVRGNIDFNLTGSSLSESSASTNFNPMSTPYQGISDADMTDSYPTRLKGLVYVSGQSAVSGTLNIDGCMIIGGMLTGSSGSQIQLTYDPTFFASPPPGFSKPPLMAISPGSWVQATDANEPLIIIAE